MDPLATKVLARFITGSVASDDVPMVIEQVKMVPQTELICPHCKTAMHEKGIGYDGKNWFHRAATCLGKPMRMPPPKYTPDWLKPYME
jgi:hypothetical protein